MTEFNLPDNSGIQPTKLNETIEIGTIHPPDGDPSPWDDEWHNAFERWSLQSPVERIFLIFSDIPGVLAKEFGGSTPILALGNEKNLSSGVYLASRTIGGISGGFKS